jgi:hypothetical protein
VSFSSRLNWTRRLNSERRHIGPDKLLGNTRRQWIGTPDGYGIGLVHKAWRFQG